MNLGVFKIITDIVWQDGFINKEGLLNLSVQIPQISQDLYEDAYKSYCLMANFQKGGKLVLLNSEAGAVLNLIDGKRTVKDIFEITASAKKDLSLKSILEQSSAYWRGRLKFKDLFHLILGKTIRLESFLLFFSILKKAQIIFLRKEIKTEMATSLKEKILMSDFI